MVLVPKTGKKVKQNLAGKFRVGKIDAKNWQRLDLNQRPRALLS